MKAWISRGIGYYTVFPSQRPAILFFHPEDCRSNNVGPGEEQETGRKGGGHNF